MIEVLSFNMLEIPRTRACSSGCIVREWPDECTDEDRTHNMRIKRYKIDCEYTYAFPFLSFVTHSHTHPLIFSPLSFSQTRKRAFLIFSFSVCLRVSVCMCVCVFFILKILQQCSREHDPRVSSDRRSMGTVSLSMQECGRFVHGKYSRYKKRALSRVQVRE